MALWRRSTNRKQCGGVHVQPAPSSIRCGRPCNLTGGRTCTQGRGSSWDAAAAEYSWPMQQFELKEHQILITGHPHRRSMCCLARCGGFSCGGLIIQPVSLSRKRDRRVSECLAVRQASKKVERTENMVLSSNSLSARRSGESVAQEIRCSRDSSQVTSDLTLATLTARPSTPMAGRRSR